MWTFGCGFVSGCAGSCAHPRIAMPLPSTISAVSARPTAMPARDFKKKLTTLRHLLFINLPSLQRGLFLVAFVASVGLPKGCLFLGFFSWGTLGQHC